MMQQRIRALAVVVAVIPIGLLARSMRSGADTSTVGGFLAAYTGDTLWPVMFYFIARFLFPAAKFGSLLAFAVSLTLGIEFLQLWQPGTLQWLRTKPVIGFILGNTFLWSDVICCLVGSMIAVLIDMTLHLHPKASWR